MWDEDHFQEPKPFPKDIGILFVLGLQEGKCTKGINIIVTSLMKIFQANFNFQSKS